MNRPFKDLSRRERQIMDIIYEQGHASALDIQEALPDAPGYSAVRTLLRILETKGHLLHRKQGAFFVYYPTHPRNQAARSALAQVVQTFFDSNIERVVAALLSSSDTRLTADELERLSALIEQARKDELSSKELHLKELRSEEQSLALSETVQEDRETSGKEIPDQKESNQKEPGQEESLQP